MVGGLVKRPRGTLTPERKMAYESDIARKAKQITPRVVQPGEWYLARWGGTRKGSGTFYTRPQLAVPTVHRTLRPLAYDPPVGSDGQPDIDAPLEAWTPKPPEQILELKVCDPACGSGFWTTCEPIFSAVTGMRAIARSSEVTCPNYQRRKE